MLKLTKADVRRALVRHHFAPAATAHEAFHRLRSVQFDPIAPVGCNHDLVLQARVAGYEMGDWEKLAYEERFIYDGWDKQASLVPYEGWPWRRYFHHRRWENYETFRAEHPGLVENILAEIRDRGPLMPKDSEFQRKSDGPKSTWHSSNVTKQALRMLWFTGQVMTSGRKNGQHLYDLTERIVPAHILDIPEITDEAALLELFLERHRAVGILRLGAPYEVWSYAIYAGPRVIAANHHIGEGNLVAIDVEGVLTHATPEFLSLLDLPALEPKVTFVAPLDQILWDRKMINHAFDFDYVWEIYTPEAKRRWGYYVLPVLYGDRFVARAEFYARDGILEVRRWIDEADAPTDAIAEALTNLMKYSKTSEIRYAPGVRSLLG